MKFDITRIWYEHFHAARLGKDVKSRLLLELIDWLDENAGWCISNDAMILPYMGLGWRIDHAEYDPEALHSYGIVLTIDSDEISVMFKLTYGDRCDK